jgi:hypothetical protein
MIKIILEIENKKYTISGVTVNAYNRQNEEDSYPGENALMLYVKSMQIDQFLWDWVNNKAAQKKDGKIIILNEDDGSATTILFKNACSMSFNMNLYAADNISNDISVTLSAEKILIKSTNGQSGKDERFA